MNQETTKIILSRLKKIIEGCENVQNTESIHKDAKSLAREVKKDCQAIFNVTRYAVKQADKNT